MNIIAATSSRSQSNQTQNVLYYLSRKRNNHTLKRHSPPTYHSNQNQTGLDPGSFCLDWSRSLQRAALPVTGAAALHQVRSVSGLRKQMALGQTPVKLSNKRQTNATWLLYLVCFFSNPKTKKQSQVSPKNQHKLSNCWIKVSTLFQWGWFDPSPNSLNEMNHDM